MFGRILLLIYQVYLVHHARFAHRTCKQNTPTCFAGSCSVNHSVEYHEKVIQYAIERLEEFIMTCPSFDEFDFCSPEFLHGKKSNIDRILQMIKLNVFPDSLLIA